MVFDSTGRVRMQQNWPSLDVLVIGFRPNLDLVMWTIDGFVEHTHVPWSLVTILDGCPQSDLKPVKEEIDKIENKMLVKRVVLSFPQPVYFKRALLSAIANYSESQMAVVAEPHFRVQDDEWVAKVHRPFAVDGHAAIVGFGMSTFDESLAPFRSPQPTSSHMPRTRFAVLSDRFISSARTRFEAMPMDDFTYQKNMLTIVDQLGANAWVVQNVRTSKAAVHTRHAPPMNEPAAVQETRSSTGQSARRDR